jgi:DNA-binding PadR family transcriptional regulator
MPSGRPSNPLALAVLTLLDERPMHPYQMSNTLRERSKEESIKLNYGSLYGVVESLQRRSLIEAQETIREGRRPERTVYAITDAGREAMTEWLGELLDTPAKEYPKFEAALSLMPALRPEEALERLQLRLQRLQVKRTAAEAVLSQAAAVGFPRLFAIEHEFEIALLRTEIAFVAELVGQLKSEGFAGLALWRGLHELRDQGLSPDEIDARFATEFAADMAWVEKMRPDT